ncbi:hypothetical protein F4825DRAFT_340174 [Nemania diffusa]|nr:hypothetical protein F4825DRAFT_340174 [Nemania diffusa]
MASNPRRTAALAVLDPNVRDGLTLKSKRALCKGATFHSPVTPPASPQSAQSFKVPSLPRRSQTSLDDVVGAHVRRAALNIGKIEDSLTATDGESSSGRRLFQDDSLPIPRGFLSHTIIRDKTAMESSFLDMERRVLRPRTRRSSHHHESDSGVGTSIASTSQKRKETRSSVGASTITRSVNISGSESLPRLSPRAVNRIHEHTLKPLLAKPELKAFRPIVLDCPRRIQENQIICLRDLEKTLLFMAPERASSAKMYLDFCTTSIQCIQATVEYLSDREQTRPHDRPYNSGYFIDLIDQIRRHAEHMQQSRDRQASGQDPTEMDVDPTDEVKLIGGLSTTGRQAELVRVKKDGTAISLATGQVVEDLEAKGAVRFKRSMSQQADEEEELMRSMARRKKNASPEELAPKKCTHPGCSKEFKRACDLTKHEKTHSRPWKCPIPSCKYHEDGWPTEKEMARHINDKHSSAPQMHECQFKPCPYKSKRESNCKQHMEKAHGWTYTRSKAPKTKASKAGSTSGKPTPMLNNLPTPSSDHTDPILTPHEDTFLPTFEDNQDLFPAYPSTDEFNAELFGNPTFDVDGDLTLDFSPIDDSSISSDNDQFNTYQDLSPEFTGQFEDIYGAPVRLPTPTYHAYNKTILETPFNFNAPMCPPASHFSPSGHGNTMLYTPTSMVDEGFAEDFPTVGTGQFGDDFTLFPSNDLGKHSDFAPALFETSAPDYNNIGFMDWAPSQLEGFPHH